VEATSEAYFPDAHSTQVSSEDSPSVEEIFPAAHAVHVAFEGAELAVLYRPTPQSVQKVDACSKEYFPGTQSAQISSDEAPSVVDTFPATQEVQSVSSS
jgi:hypothetical protein